MTRMARMGLATEAQRTRRRGKREEGSGCTAKVAKVAKDAERRASHQSTRIDTNPHQSSRRPKADQPADPAATVATSRRLVEQQVFPPCR